MLHSGHLAAKLLIDNRLRVHKAHFIVVAISKISPILWFLLQSQVKQILNSGTRFWKITKGSLGEISRVELLACDVLRNSMVIVADHAISADQRKADADTILVW